MLSTTFVPFVGCLFLGQETTPYSYILFVDY